MSTPDRRARLDRAHGSLSIRRQCRLLGLARSSVYRTPAPPDEDDLALMRRIDELFTAWPFLGSRRMAQMPGGDGDAINRKRGVGGERGDSHPRDFLPPFRQPAAVGFISA